MFTPPWRKHKRPDTGGRQARLRAEKDLERVRSETQQYAELAEDLRRIGARNHLAAAFIIAAQGRRPAND